jgi:hypothetical protein
LRQIFDKSSANRIVMDMVLFLSDPLHILHQFRMTAFFP